MLPEFLRGLIIAEPKLVHKVECGLRARLLKGLHNLGACVCPGAVAVLIGGSERREGIGVQGMCTHFVKIAVALVRPVAMEDIRSPCL